MKNSEFLSDDFLSSLDVLDWGYTEEARPRTFPQYLQWTEKGLHGPLGYLADHRRELRSDLRNVYPEFQSALVFLFGYQATKKWMLENERHEVAGHALGFGGEDYHYALKRRLLAIFEKIKEGDQELQRFISLDIQAVLERDLALRAGLGWFGKNSMLINQKHGSYFIIGSLLLNKKLPLGPVPVDVDHCGRCLNCVEACPTQAIDPYTRTLKANQCISTFTIELMKEAAPPYGFDTSRGEIFGCDICQDVCPWNKRSLGRITSMLKLQERFEHLKRWLYEVPKQELFELIKNESNRGWRKKLQGSAFDRPGRVGWLKNLKAIFSSGQNALSGKRRDEE